MSNQRESEAEMGSREGERVVLVTGGAGYLGRHVVRRFLEGNSVVHVPVQSPEDGESLEGFLQEMTESLHIHVSEDLASPEIVQRLMGDIEATGSGSPGVLLNLAGGFSMSSIEETTPDDWNRMIGMNATTAFLLSRSVIPGMKQAGWGRIINVAAFPAIERGQAQLTAYGAAKAAVLNLTQSLAREVVRNGITVNAVIPSIIDTPANREAMPDAGRDGWLSPDDIAGVIRFLASDDASIVTGAAIPLTLD
jgi:NAD(P)-dependent dehydrogenase (short-subunit alcohol dehydrogenase family)